MKKLIAVTGVSITTGSTYDNVASAARSCRARSSSTPQNALFKGDWLVHDEVAEDLIEQVTVGVDPSGGADEVGIVAALLNDGRFAVLADRSTSGSPAQWGEAVVRCHDDFDADDVVVEVNFGGDMATEVVKQAAAACGYALANAGHETRRIRDWLGHRLIAHTARYTQLSAAPFKDFWRL